MSENEIEYFDYSYLAKYLGYEWDEDGNLCFPPE